MATFGSYPAPPGGNDDFTPGSVIASSEHDGNFAALATHLNSQFVADDVTADGALGGPKITDNTITGQQISRKADPGGAAISQNHLELLSVGTPELIDLSVTTAKIADLAVTDAKINDVDGSKIVAASIPASALDNTIQFPISVTDEVIQFAFNGEQVALASSNVEPTNITVTGVGGAPVYVQGVDWNFVAPNIIEHIPAGSIPLATNVEVDYIAAAAAPPLNSVGSPQIINDSILDADINSAAGIQLSKLATDPLARANHTGTQVAATISDFAAATQGVAVGGDLTGTVGAAAIAANAVGTDEIGTLPSGFIRRSGTGAPLATPGTWQPIYFPDNEGTQGGMAVYNDGTNNAGFTVPINGWYNITVSGDFTSASSTSATAVGARIRQVSGNRTNFTLAKNVQGWSGAAISPSAGCSINAYLTAGSVVIGQFNAIGDNPVPDIESSLSIQWVSD